MTNPSVTALLITAAICAFGTLMMAIWAPFNQTTDRVFKAVVASGAVAVALAFVIHGVGS